jgi:hypothetical protein
MNTTALILKTAKAEFQTIKVMVTNKAEYQIHIYSETY